MNVSGIRVGQRRARGIAAVAALTASLSMIAATASAEVIRFATFNASMNRNAFGDLRTALVSGSDLQIQTVAEIIQRAAPDVLLINEFDYDPTGPSLPQLFQDNYLSVPQNVSGQGPSSPILYPYNFWAPSNTGVPSGFDLDNNGTIGGPNDAFGFGLFEGQFGMAVFSRYEIVSDDVRTFQTFLWKDMPGARLPADPLDADGNGDTENWFTPEELEVVRLSSKSHWDIPLQIGDDVVHFLVSHPTPPVFDGPEDRNGLRNADEIRFWADYIDGADYFYDDAGGFGGLPAGAKFVIAGDLNADPLDGDSVPGAAQQLLDHPLVNTALTPSSAGGPDAAARQGGANAGHLGDPAFDTADFADGSPGNLRVDYVLPSRQLAMVDAGVFWPVATDPLFSLVGDFPFPSSDHRLVFVDVQVPLPATLPLLAGGLVAFGLLARRRR